jgi:hypothetical protein
MTYATWNFMGIEGIPSWVAGAILVYVVPPLLLIISIIYLKLKGEITISGLISEINW